MIENERKYVLLPKNEIGLMSDLELMGTTTVDKIFQAYLPGNARIRRKVNKYACGYVDPDTKEYVAPEDEKFFTYKVLTTSGLVEIETELSDADWERLFPVAQRKIVKTRISVPVGDLTWEVDFFHDEYNANLYLVMAEVELPEGVDAPDEIPAFVSTNLLYAVERDDRRFDNANLSDPDAVRATVAYIHKQKQQADNELEQSTGQVEGQNNVD